MRRFASEDKPLWKRVIFGKYGAKKRVGVLGKVAMVLALDWERQLGEGGTPLIEEPFPMWVIIGGSSFGKISSMVNQH